MRHLKRLGMNIVWEDPAGRILYRLRWIEEGLPWLPAFARKTNLRLIQIVYALFHWGYYGNRRIEKNGSIEARAASLKRILSKLPSHHDLFVLTRSSGGRVASLIVDEFPIKRFICLGYPFRHPKRCDEPERYRHLRCLRTSTLLLQGASDCYGGLESRDRYVLGPNTRLEFVETNHEFRLSEREFEKVARTIETAIAESR